MLGTSVASPSLTFVSGTRFCFSAVLNPPDTVSLSVIEVRGWTCAVVAKKWNSQCNTQTDQISLNNDDKGTWETCTQALSCFNFGPDEQKKMLGKAFGQVHSPYWGEDRKKEDPLPETVQQILDYLRSLTLSDEDISKLLNKFPEVLGCNLEEELKKNVKILETNWGIKGKTLRNLILRNPKVLGYNVDCKGDCMAQCTRCWVRF